MIHITKKRRLKFKQALIKVLFAAPILIWQSYTYPAFTGFHYPWNIISYAMLGLLNIVLFLLIFAFSDVISPLLMRHDTIPGGFSIQRFRPTKIGGALLLAIIASTILLIVYSHSCHMHTFN